jgi:hypothetical protein
VLDGVFNHASRGFLPFHDILENGPDSPWLEWFRIGDWPLAPYDESRPANYDCWLGNRALPKFNTDHRAGARVPDADRRTLGPRFRHRRLASGRAGRDHHAGILGRVPATGPRDQAGCVSGRRDLGRCARLAARRSFRRHDELSTDRSHHRFHGRGPSESDAGQQPHVRSVSRDRRREFAQQIDRLLDLYDGRSPRVSSICWTATIRRGC